MLFEITAIAKLSVFLVLIWQLLLFLSRRQVLSLIELLALYFALLGLAASIRDLLAGKEFYYVVGVACQTLIVCHGLFTFLKEYGQNRSNDEGGGKLTQAASAGLRATPSNDD